MMYFHQSYNNLQQGNLQISYQKQQNSNKDKEEVSISLSNYNPEKSSPNVFLEKLRFRIKNYGLVNELEQDIFILDHK